MTRHYSKIVVGTCLVGAPLLILGSAVISPAIKGDEAAQIAVIAHHPGRYYAFTVLMLAGMMMLVPAILGLAHLTRERAPVWGNVGGSLALAGTLIAAGDATSQLLVWQMGAPGAGRVQMAALLERYDHTLGSSLVFAVGGLATVAGILILSIGLHRARAVPAWTAAGFTSGVVLNIAGFSAASVGIVILSSAILLAALGTIGWRVLTRSDDAWGEARGLTSAAGTPIGAPNRA